MQVPKIEITQQSALTQVSSQHPRTEISSRLAQVEIQTTPVDLGMHTEHVRVHIDQSQAFQDANLYGPFVAARKEAAKGQQSAMQAIARISADGDRLAAIENPGSPIPQFASRWRKGVKGSAFGVMPSYGSVKVSFSQGKTTLNVRESQVSMNTRPHDFQVYFQPGGARTELVRKNSISFDVSY